MMSGTYGKLDTVNDAMVFEFYKLSYFNTLLRMTSTWNIFLPNPRSIEVMRSGKKNFRSMGKPNECPIILGMRMRYSSFSMMDLNARVRIFFVGWPYVTPAFSCNMFVTFREP
jgi:hypothetical protein